MERKINFTEQELTDLKTVLKTVEPEIGIGPGHLYRIYDIVFTKSHESKLGFTKEYIDADKCYIKTGDRTITARQITEELIDQKIIIKFRTIFEDENGVKVYHDDDKKIPVRRTLYKTLF